MFLETDVIKLGEIDVSDLAEKVSALSDQTWLQDTTRQRKFAVHVDTQTIWMIYDSDFRHANPTRHPIMNEFEPLMTPVLDLIKDFYSKTLEQKIIPEEKKPGYFIRIIMTRLSPGGLINGHTDGGMSLKRCHRVHLPVITNEKCLFKTGNTTLHMRAGEVWEINNRQIHGVKNAGDEARVHMILDYVQPGEYIEDPKGPVVA